jgi:hypothetical protein
MHSEIEYGESPALTSLVGASAAPSQTPAPSPQATPIPCIDPKCWAGTVFVVVLILPIPSSVELHEQCDANAEHGQWNQEVDIREDSFGHFGEGHRHLAPLCLTLAGQASWLSAAASKTRFTLQF